MFCIKNDKPYIRVDNVSHIHDTTAHAEEKHKKPT